MSLLAWILFSPLIGVFFILFVPGWNGALIRSIGLITSISTFLLSLLLWIQFDSSSGQFQFVSRFALIPNLPTPSLHSEAIHSIGSIADLPNGEYTTLTFIMGLDGISIFFVILTTFLIPICILVGWTTIKASIKEYCIAFLVLEALLIGAFSVLDLLLFYIFFESVLIPMFLIIGIWGSREERYGPPTSSSCTP